MFSLVLNTSKKGSSTYLGYLLFMVISPSTSYLTKFSLAAIIFSIASFLPFGRVKLQFNLPLSCTRETKNGQYSSCGFSSAKLCPRYFYFSFKCKLVFFAVHVVCVSCSRWCLQRHHIMSCKAAF